MTMTRAQFPKSLQDGVNTFFGLEYDNFDTEYDKIFDTHNSSKAYEEDVLMVGLGPGSVKQEGSAVQYDSGQEGWVARYLNVTIGHAFAITEEMVEDGRYGDTAPKYARSMARGMRYTKEVRGISILNNGFDSAFAGGDGKELFATDHPLAGGGTFANELTTAADLSEESIEDAMIAIRGFVDDRGIPMQAKARRLIIPRQLMFVAPRILNSTKQSGTANNDINALKEAGAFPDGILVSTYLSDPDAWFIKTDVNDGLKHFVRRKLRKGMEGDFETGNMRYKCTERYSFGFTDPRGGFASAGA
jgi:phage major head subunit gpT-like protein